MWPEPLNSFSLFTTLSQASQSSLLDHGNEYDDDNHHHLMSRYLPLSGMPFRLLRHHVIRALIINIGAGKNGEWKIKSVLQCKLCALWIWFLGTWQIFMYNFPIILLHKIWDTSCWKVCAPWMQPPEVQGKFTCKYLKNLGLYMRGNWYHTLPQSLVHSDFLFTINYSKNICTIFPTAIILNSNFQQYEYHNILISFLPSITAGMV